MKRYGFLGLGIMGKAMANNLIDAGFEVTVWNRTREKCNPLVDKGAHLGETPCQVISQCDTTFAMVSDPPAAEALVFDTDGVLQGMTRGKSYIDVSTVCPATVKKIAKAVEQKGGRFLEAPVSGSKKPAEEGKLVFLCSGDESLYLEAAPAFEVMGKKSFFFKELGQGAQMKLVINMIMGTMMTAFSEGLALGEKARLNMADILEVLTQGAIDNPMFRLKGPQMIHADFSTAFPLKHMQKDMRLALQLGDELRLPLFTAGAANNLYLKTTSLGGAEEDFSAVLKAINS